MEVRGIDWRLERASEEAYWKPGGGGKMVGFPTKEWWLSRSEKLWVTEGCGGCGKAWDWAGAWEREAWARAEDEPMGGKHRMVGLGRRTGNPV